MDEINALRQLVRVIDSNDQDDRELHCRRLVAELGCRKILNSPMQQWVKDQIALRGDKR